MIMKMTTMILTKIKSMMMFPSHMAQMRRNKAYQSMTLTLRHPNLSLMMKMKMMMRNPIKLKVPTKTKNKPLMKWPEDWTTSCDP